MTKVLASLVQLALDSSLSTLFAVLHCISHQYCKPATMVKILFPFSTVIVSQDTCQYLFVVSELHKTETHWNNLTTGGFLLKIFRRHKKRESRTVKNTNTNWKRKKWGQYSHACLSLFVRDCKPNHIIFIDPHSLSSSLSYPRSVFPTAVNWCHLVPEYGYCNITNLMLRLHKQSLNLVKQLRH